LKNGKKYPKPDKIAILSEKLDVPYDQNGIVEIG
jgi:hypothetical protein